MQSLVDELRILMGNAIEIMTGVGKLLIRGTLIFGTTDLLAAAKIVGFSAHNALTLARNVINILFLSIQLN